tara:strand:+ start:432 stop:560 length:129 start_codon:yes stop_codon:yes gene_type:complete
MGKETNLLIIDAADHGHLRYLSGGDLVDLTVRAAYVVADQTP